MRTASESRRETVPPAKPKGGYQLIPAVRLALAWWAYREKLIRLVDLRVWFAACEMAARRCGRPAPLPRRFGLGELQGLTGLSLKRLKASLRRLEAARLLAWSESAITFPVSAEAVPLADRDGFRRFLGRIPNHRRLVPVPRRILRLLAGGARPALIATILGHLFRCLYLKGGQCLPVGRVKASWIADAFGVGLRRVKQARQDLIAMRWLIPVASDQWALNRWGALVRINLAWSRLDGLAPSTGAPAAAQPGPDGADRPSPAPAVGPELASPPPDLGPQLAPPDSSDEEPFQDDKNQKPAPGGPAGFSISHPEEQTAADGGTQAAGGVAAPQAAAAVVPARPAALETSPCPASRAAGDLSPDLSAEALAKGEAWALGDTPGKPDLRNVVPQDLKDTGRLLDLFEQAVEEGLVTPCEWDRLRFVAAAEHARIIGTKNPSGLFIRLVRGGLFHFATNDDEEAASVRLRRHLYRGIPEMRGAAGLGMRPLAVVELSDDARLVQAVRAATARAGYRGDAFPLLKREKPEWTRARWDQAVAELER